MQLDQATIAIQGLLEERAPGWNVVIDLTDFRGEPAVVVEANHPASEGYRWAFTESSARRAVEMVSATIDVDPEFVLVDEAPDLVNRDLVLGIKQLAGSHDWTPAAIADVADLLARTSTINAEEADWLRDHLRVAVPTG